MKTLSITLLALFIAVSFTACKKEADVDPDLANRVAGRYSLSKIEVNGTTKAIKDTYFTGAMEVKRESATSVTLILDVKGINNSPFLTGNIDNVTLTDVGNGEVELTKDGNNLGRGGKNSLALRGTDTAGAAFVLTGTK